VGGYTNTKKEEVKRMIEVNLKYDLLPGMDQQSYVEWAKKAIGTTLKTPGLVEIRAYRSMLGSPQVQVTSVWQTMADWAKFNESDGWRALSDELKASFATNVNVEIWGPSPIIPKPLRPGK